jgi:hypothetical protein
MRTHKKKTYKHTCAYTHVAGLHVLGMGLEYGTPRNVHTYACTHTSTRVTGLYVPDIGFGIYNISIIIIITYCILHTRGGTGYTGCGIRTVLFI